MNYLQTKCNKSKKSGRNVLRWCNKILAVTFFVCCALLFKSILAGFSFVQEDETIFRSRRLLALVAWEQCDFEIGHERNYSFRESWWAPNEAYGWLTLYIICVLIIFVALAIVCDDFFVPSLEAISEKLDLSEDVAGATFMAAGSSAPELFTSVAGVTQQSDVGVGTIVGSAIFNLLVIIALTAALAGQVLQLDWRPLCRDSICYALSIGFFIWFSWDGKFEFYESAILLLLYVFYIVLMKFNYKLMDLLSGIGPKTGQISPQVTETVHIVTDVESPLGNKARDGAPSTNPDADHGTPPGKLPPLPRTTDNLDPSAVPSDHHKPHKHFAHSHKGELSRSISNLALGRSQHSSDVMTRLSVSFPILRDLKNGEKTNRRSSESHLHEHHHIRIKSIAQGQVRKEMRRRSELLRSETGRLSLPTNQQTVTIVEVEANGNVLPSDSGHISPIESQAVFEKADNEANSVEDEEPTIKVLPCLKPVSAEIPVYPEGKKSLLKTMKYVVGWLLFVVSFPFICMFTWTIPDCSKPHNRKYFMVSFFMSIVWIALLSLAMVTLVGRSGCILSVDKFTMGLVVVAIGTSVPDALSSILVARDGFGDMAVSNAIGSNVFDINLGLGLPFVIACLINNMDPIHLLSPEEEAILEADGMIMVPHAKFGFLLLLILVIALVVFVLVRFTLKRIVGVCFVTMYILFVAYAYIQDLYCQHSC